MIIKNIAKRNLSLLAFIPLVVDLLLISLVSGGNMIWSLQIPILLLLLAIIGVGIISNKKVMQWVWIGALMVLTVLLSIIGYYDYFQWFSTIIAFVLLAYFAFIGMSMKKFNIS